MRPVIRSLFAWSAALALAGCAADDAGGHSLELRDPLGLLDDIDGNLRLLAFPTGDYACDRATGIVMGPEGPVPDTTPIPGSVVDISFAPGAAAADRTVSVPPGSYELIVRGRGTDPVSMIPDTIICSGCSTEAIAEGETRDVTIELRPVFGEGVCGDGTLSPDEQCEDMNTMSGDGCTAMCRTESSLGIQRSDGMVAAEILPAVAWAPGTRVGLVYDAGDMDGRDARIQLLTESAAFIMTPAALQTDAPFESRPAIQTQPAIAIGGARFGIAYTDFLMGGDGDVRVAFLDTDRNLRGSSLATMASAGGQTEPSIALAADGAALVVFTNTASPTGLSGRAFAAGATMPLGAVEFPVGMGATGAAGAAVTAIPSGFLVAFSAGGVVRYQRFMPDGTAIDAESRTIGTDAGRDQVSAASLSDGRTLVAWRGGAGIGGAVIDDTGAAGMPFMISTTAGTLSDPSVAAGFDRFLVAWAGANEIRARVFDRTGAPALNREHPPTSDDFLVASGPVLTPAAAAGGANLSLVAYQDNSMDPGGNIAIRRFPLP
jgi:cysteine-rich repeat protein